MAKLGEGGSLLRFLEKASKFSFCRRLLDDSNRRRRRDRFGLTFWSLRKPRHSHAMDDWTPRQLLISLNHAIAVSANRNLSSYFPSSPFNHFGRAVFLWNGKEIEPHEFIWEHP
jgi:hypothetical protein